MRYMMISIWLLVGMSACSACGDAWTYIGAPVGAPLCIHELTTSPGTFLCGTPNGLFRWSGEDTTWTFVSLQNSWVAGLWEFPAFPGVLFVIDDYGLYRSADEGRTWDLVTNDLAIQANYTDFIISPFDSAQWFVYADWEGVGPILTSTDAGHTWRRGPISTMIDLTFFTETPRLLYSQSRYSLNAMQLDDSTQHIVYRFPALEWLMKIVRHPTEPWIYMIGDWHIVRYNVLTGDTLAVSLPDTAWYWTNGKIMRPAPGVGLLVSTTDSLYAVDADLQRFAAVFGAPSDDRGIGVLFASEDRWIVSVGEHHGLWCRSPMVDAVWAARPAPVTMQIQSYPNPFNATTTVTYGLPQWARTQLTIYDILGRQIQTFAPAWMPPGTHQLRLDCEDWSSGLYILRLESGKVAATIKLLLEK